MYRILKIGLDVHSTNYTICILESLLGQNDKVWLNTQIEPDYREVIKLIGKVKQKIGKGDTFDIQCGYEAGCIGYTLYRDLNRAGVPCVILAPSTMKTEGGKRIKTDARDARLIADCLSSNGYSPVYVPNEDDDDIKEYIRARDDHKAYLKTVKQRIKAFCLRQGKQYSGSENWTRTYLDWLWKLELRPLQKETLNEYLTTYAALTEKIERLDKRIAEFSTLDPYREKVQNLQCFLGIRTVTAMALIVETGDFARFPNADRYAAYLGLVPGEHTSNGKGSHLGITKAGNNHLRRLLVESAQGLSKGKIGYKSAELRKRQEGNPPEVIAYADRANTRLRSKYYRLLLRGKKKNTVVAAVARELACFVWGMMTRSFQVRSNS